MTFMQIFAIYPMEILGVAVILLGSILLLITTKHPNARAFLIECICITVGMTLGLMLEIDGTIVFNDGISSAFGVFSIIAGMLRLFWIGSNLVTYAFFIFGGFALATGYIVTF